MSTRHVVDAHALIWYLESNAKLGGAAKTILDDLASNLVLPVIALAEAAHIVNKGRTRIPSVSDLLTDVIGDPRFEVYPLTFEVLQESLNALAVPEMHDRLIVAIGLHLQNQGGQVSILTKDADIIASTLLPVIWT
ncbi:MAG: PIN domain-containing protein [Acidobacteriota bacterium]|nr:PIN domain-containing protein [Acidobacteriota bacterium]